MKVLEPYYMSLLSEKKSIHKPEALSDDEVESLVELDEEIEQPKEETEEED